MFWKVFFIVLGVILAIIAVMSGLRIQWYGDEENWLIPILGVIFFGALSLAALALGIFVFHSK